MEELLKYLREKRGTEVKFGQSPIEVKRVNFRYSMDPSDDTHDKVYELNKQMYDLEIDRDWWEAIGKEWASKKQEIVDSIFNKIDMEKKTKKMTKAEAFEYLNNKKVYVNGKRAQIQATLFDAGFSWVDGKVFRWLDMPFLFISADRISFSSSMVDFKHMLSYEEISADDILSIEIVEGTPEFSYDKVVELAKPLMEYLNDTGCTYQIGVSYDHIVAQPMATFLHGEMKGC